MLNNPRMFLVRPIAVLFPSLLFGGAFLLPFTSITTVTYHVSGRYSVGTSIVSFVVLLVAIAATIAFLFGKPARGMEGFAAWFVEYHFGIARWGWGLAPSSVAIKVRVDPSPQDKEWLLVQWLLFLPIDILVSVASTILTLLSLPVFLWALVTGNLPSWWVRVVRSALCRLAPLMRLALLGTRWREEIIVPATI